MSGVEDSAPPPRRWGRRTKIVAAIVGALFVACAATAASNWTVGLNPGSSGEAQAGTVLNLTIVATNNPAAGNLLFPGGNGDVVIKITNPNTYPVTLTALNLPANTVFANGFTDSALTTPAPGCSSATSTVTYAFATGVSGTSHTLTTPLVIAANGQANNPLFVTLTNDAVMGGGSPAACEGVFFQMPSFTAVTASAGGAPVTTTPATDAWTS